MPGLAADARRFLAELGAGPKKRFGQNFMVSEKHLRAIADALTVNSDVPVLEIGPGLGFLTRFLLERGYRVTTVEKDRVFAASLEKRLNHGALRVVEGDILSSSAETLGLKGAFAVAANIPYNITTPILEWLIDRRASVREAVLTVQKEVAERLLAKPGTKAWGSLTIFVRTYADLTPVCQIPRGAFFPAPNVDSAAIRIAFLEEAREDLGDPEVYSSIVRKSFQKRRKTILNALDGIVVGAGSPRPGKGAGTASLHKPDLSKAFKACGIDPRRRPETLTLQEWAKLSVRLSTANFA